MRDTALVVLMLYGALFAVCLLWGAIEEWRIYRRWGRHIQHLWSECTPQMIVCMTLLRAARHALIGSFFVIALFFLCAVLEGIFVGLRRF